MNINYIIADYENPEHANAVLSLLQGYALDPMGGEEALPEYASANLIASLRDFPGAFSMLGHAGAGYVALANCFMGFSTFACKPLVNIHDLVVTATARGQGVSQGLLAAVESEAVSRGCCKVTLEVLEGNTVARNAYAKFGFIPYALDDSTGDALLLQKKLQK